MTSARSTETGVRATAPLLRQLHTREVLGALQRRGPLSRAEIVRLTGISGPELASRARRARDAQRVLFMSGYVDAAVLRDGPLQAGTHFLQKPFTAGGLGRKVREALDAPR